MKLHGILKTGFAIFKEFLVKHLDVCLALLLFILALVPRLLALDYFVTADEHKWMVRSAQFLLALLHGDWQGTEISYNPAVTTMAAGGLGIWLHNLAGGGSNLTDLLVNMPEEYIKDLDLLAAARMPVAVLVSLFPLFVYFQLTPLTQRFPAFVAASFAGLNPFFIAHSRFLNTDALVTVFGLASVIWLIRHVQTPDDYRCLVFSAISAGLAFLTKSPILFLIPFTILVIGVPYFLTPPAQRDPIFHPLKELVIWGVVAYAAFYILYPAAWSQPIQEPIKIVQNALNSAEGEDVSEVQVLESQTPELGAAYYPVYFVFRAAPLVIPGLILWLIFRKKAGRTMNQTANMLITFAILFMAFMTISQKRSDRYILPSMIALDVVAGLGLAMLWQEKSRIRQASVAGLLCVFQAAVLIPYAPYYLTYFNPLVGGPLTAPKLLRIGWGEGLDAAGRWLASRPDAAMMRCGTYYKPTLQSFFPICSNAPDDEGLDYVVLYIKRWQAGYPSEPIWTYYQSQTPLKTINLAGIDYAMIYTGPAMRPAIADAFKYGDDKPPHPVAFKEASPDLQLGADNSIEVMWSGSLPNGKGASDITLQPLDAFKRTSNEDGKIIEGEFQILASSTGLMEKRKDGLQITQYGLNLPGELKSGDYALAVARYPLGQVRIGHFSMPGVEVKMGAWFGNKIRLLGYNIVNGSAGKTSIELVWQANDDVQRDYTFFLHAVDAKGERLAGVDKEPAIHTSQWKEREIITDRWKLPETRGMPRGEYRLLLGAYSQPDMQRLAISDAQNKVLGDTLELPYRLKVE